jgi:chorismate mutase
MVETHFDPDSAWSDAKQQITPKNLDQMTVDLRMRKENDQNVKYTNRLNTYRTQIDVIDNKLAEMMGKRMKIADAIGVLKKENNVAILQNKRWNEIIDKMILEGGANNLSEEFMLRIYKAIHLESINHQKKTLGN